MASIKHDVVNVDMQVSEILHRIEDMADQSTGPDLSAIFVAREAAADFRSTVFQWQSKAAELIQQLDELNGCCIEEGE